MEPPWGALGRAIMERPRGGFKVKCAELTSWTGLHILSACPTRPAPRRALAHDEARLTGDLDARPAHQRWLVIDGTGNAGFYGAVGVEGERVRILRGDVSGVEAAPGHRRHRARRLPGLHRRPRPLRAGHPGRAAPRAEGPPGGHDRADRHRRQLLRPVPLARGLPALRRAELRARRQPAAAGQLVERGRVPRRCSTTRSRSTSATSSATRRCGSPPSAGTTARPRATELANMQALLREAMEEGAFGISTGLDYPPGSYADTDELVALCREAARLGGIYHTHVRYSLGDRFLDPFREAIEIGRRSGIPVHITHFYQRATAAGGAEPAARPGRGRPRDRGARRHLRQLPLHLGRHPAADPASRTGPTTAGPSTLKEVLARPGRARAAARGDRAARHPLAGHVADLLQAPAQPPVRGPLDGRDRHDAGPGPGRRALRPAAGGGSADLASSPPAVNLATLPKFVRPPLSMVGSDARADRRLPQPAHLRLLPDHPGRVRPRGALPGAARGDPQDDLVPGPAARHPRSRPAARRLQGGHRRLRPEHASSRRPPATSPSSSRSASTTSSSTARSSSTRASTPASWPGARCAAGAPRPRRRAESLDTSHRLLEARKRLGRAAACC